LRRIVEGRRREREEVVGGGEEVERTERLGKTTFTRGRVERVR
jgi:hypothetical protein